MAKASMKQGPGGVKPTRGRPPLDHRNAQIVAHYRESGSLRATAKAYNLTFQRVSQIVSKAKI